MRNGARLSGRKFYRDSTRAMIGGVCSGVADYFGFNLCATRWLTVLAAFVLGPIVPLLYIGIVLLVPSRELQERVSADDREFARALRAAPKTTIGDVRRRYQSLDTRLARLERYVTSPRYNLDQEFRNL